MDTQVDLSTDTYITDYYSVENHLCSGIAVERILTDVMGISAADQIYHEASESIAHALETFHLLLVPWMAWCLAALEAGDKPNLNNADLKRLIRIDADGGVSKHPRAFAKFRQSLCKESSVTGPRLFFWAKRIRFDEPKMWVRGKYELWFFSTALKIVLISLAERERKNGRKIRIPLAVRQGELFDLLGGRLPPPATLADFLSRRLN